jgi:hypothetical protein
VETLSEQLEARKLGVEATAHWLGFITRGLAFLCDAESELEANWAQLLVKIAGRGKAAATAHIPEETDLTAELGHLVRRAIHRLTIEDPMCAVQVSIEPPLESATRTGRYSGRIDLRLSDPFRRIELVFEAKRLMGSDAGDYTGAEGMGRFCCAEPYSDQPVGGMLGFVLENTAPSWVLAIEEKVGKKLVAEVTPSGGKSTVHYSVEERTAAGLPDVLLLHRLIDFCAICQDGAAMMPAAEAAKAASGAGKARSKLRKKGASKKNRKRKK